MLFSRREGIKAAKTAIQVGRMDDDLRNSLWNTFVVTYNLQVVRKHLLVNTSGSLAFFQHIWIDYLKQPVDTLDSFGGAAFEKLKTYFFNFEWYEVYDFIEFIALDPPNSAAKREFTKTCNTVLKREVSGYRFVKNQIVPITSDAEINELEKALGSSGAFKVVAEHLNSSITLFANRESPDYRNSIKESVSAVEAISRLISDDPQATLGQALKAIEEKGKLKLHPALKGAFDKLYGYTSDADGIRHAMLEESNLGSEDAQFMLIACSAFVNYLKTKSSEAGIQL